MIVIGGGGQPTDRRRRDPCASNRQGAKAAKHDRLAETRSISEQADAWEALDRRLEDDAPLTSAWGAPMQLCMPRPREKHGGRLLSVRNLDIFGWTLRLGRIDNEFRGGMQNVKHYRKH